MSTDDRELIRSWQQGGHAAFTALVRRWQQPVARFLYHLVERKEAVPDLCQEVFLRVFQARSHYRETGHFPTWLYQIALNAVRDAGRRRRHEPLSLTNGELPTPSPEPPALCSQRETSEAVNRAIADLPEPLRLVLVLRHYEGMNFEEMARLLQAPASTLKSRFAVALAKLRERLRVHNDNDSSSP
jgi:RNA polymerase sigma-70 factor (ECF subfamily)